jgi:hypothetical protein
MPSRNRPVLNGTFGAGPSHISQSSPGGGAVSGGLPSPSESSFIVQKLRTAVIFRARPSGRRRRTGGSSRSRGSASDLRHPPVVAGGVGHRPRLAREPRHRLLAVDVLAGLERGDRDDRVPMGRRRDDHGVEVFLFEQLAEVGVAAGLAAGLRTARRRCSSYTSQTAPISTSGCGRTSRGGRGRARPRRRSRARSFRRPAPGARLPPPAPPRLSRGPSSPRPQRPSPRPRRSPSGGHGASSLLP